MSMEQEVNSILELVEAEFKPLVAELLAGPDDVRALLIRAAEFRQQPEPPPWVAAAVRGLRPLSRKFLVRTLERHGMPLQENEHTRSLGFFD